jgi:hypothetical protein
MCNIGMLTVRNEVDVINEFLDDVALYFDTVVVMDDSNDGTYEAIASRPFVKYLVKYSDVYDPKGKRTDGQKQHLFNFINENYGYGNWITNLNADAFFGHDPNKMCEMAEAENANLIVWDSWTFYPHINDKERYLESPVKWNETPIRKRLRYATDTGWPENLQFKNQPGQEFDVNRHACVIPSGIFKVASFIPTLLHYPLRSPEQIIARCDDRALTGFRTPEYYQTIIASGGFVDETFEHFAHTVEFEKLNIKTEV